MELEAHTRVDLLPERFEIRHTFRRTAALSSLLLTPTYHRPAR